MPSWTRQEVNAGYVVLGLGVLGIIAGAILYVTGSHHTIGLGGIGLGVLLVLLGVMLRSGRIKVGPAKPSESQM
jgi:hypothetical protein